MEFVGPDLLERSGGQLGFEEAVEAGQIIPCTW
jgi:hypothetical protein